MPRAVRRRWYFWRKVPPMAFDVQISEDSAKLVLSGDIDLQVSGDIKTEIERLADRPRLEIDASEVTYRLSGVAFSSWRASIAPETT